MGVGNYSFLGRGGMRRIGQYLEGLLVGVGGGEDGIVSLYCQLYVFVVSFFLETGGEEDRYRWVYLLIRGLVNVIEVCRGRGGDGEDRVR